MSKAARAVLVACVAMVSSAARVADAEIVRLPQGAAIVADGVVNDAEWQDAGVYYLSLSDAVRVKVLAKHDGVNLLAAYISDLNPSRTLFMPELVIDTAFDRATAWQPDDWWFHVSASDCQSSGRWGDYSTCLVVQPDWIGVPNYPMNNPAPALIEQFEISIPLSKLGLTPGDTCGLAFTVAFITDQRAFWPPTASIWQPGSWAEVLLCDGGCPVTANVPSSLGAAKLMYR